jgi:hypothetical protein
MTDQRHSSRMSLNVPVRVSGFAKDGKPWEEMTTSGDASRQGASFLLQQHVDRGQVVLLQLPLPKTFRAYDINELTYKVFGLVRNIAVLDDTLTSVGVLFLGKTAPRDYQTNPGIRYLLPTDPAPKPSDRRSEERRTVFVTLKIVSPDGRSELTVAEDLSKGGSRVPTSLPVEKGQVVTVEELSGEFNCRAEVRNVFKGEDGVTRLNLKFIDGGVPDRLLG